MSELVNDGIYWVRFHQKAGTPVTMPWEISQYVGGSWFCINDDWAYRSSDVDEIGPQVLPPGEPSTGKAEPPPGWTPEPKP